MVDKADIFPSFRQSEDFLMQNKITHSTLEDKKESLSLQKSSVYETGTNLPGRHTGL